LTHLDLDPDLWLKAGSSGGLDRNHVYNLSNTMIKDLWTTRIISIIGCSLLILSTQTPEFEVILDQQVQVQTTHHVVDYEQLNVKTTKLRRLIIKMRSQMGDIYASQSRKKHTSSSSSSSSVHRLIIFELINV
jgi:hypothetical protein